MAARPSWTGHLRISLVSFPVQLFTGSRSSRNIPLHQIHEPTGKRVRSQPVVEGVGKIDRKDIIKGYEYEKGEYVTLSPEEISLIRLTTNKTIDIAEFSNVGEIDLIYYDQPYYIVPQGDVATEAYNTFQKALVQTNKVAIGEVVLGGKEHLVSIRPYGKGMMLETLRYANEVREAHSYYDDLKDTKITDDQLSLAVRLIEEKTSPFQIAEFEDSYESALQELIDRKLKNLPLKREEDTPVAGNVVSLMDALKKSLSGKNAPAKNTSAKSAPAPGKSSKAAKPEPATKAATSSAPSATGKKPAAKKPAAKKAISVKPAAKRKAG